MQTPEEQLEQPAQRSILALVPVEKEKPSEHQRSGGDPVKEKPPRKRPQKIEGKGAPLPAPLGEGDRVDWNTPEIIVELTREVGRGAIGLDPCSNPGSIVGAVKSWSLENGNDGLAEQWAGNGLVYVNPPYGRAIVPWVVKMASVGGRNTQRISGIGEFGTEIVSLLPVRTDTGWFGGVWRAARALAFWRGRLTFLGAADPAPFASFLAYYGPNPFRFCDIFSRYAEVTVLAS